MNELKVSSEWLKEYNIKILDPDGWDRTPEGWDYSFNKEKITRSEFERRVCFSTCNSYKYPMRKSGQEVQQEQCKGKTIKELLDKK